MYNSHCVFFMASHGPDEEYAKRPVSRRARSFPKMETQKRTS